MLVKPWDSRGIVGHLPHHCFKGAAQRLDPFLYLKPLTKLLCPV